MGARAGLDGCGKSRPSTGNRSPDRPARSKSLYRLIFRGPTYVLTERCKFSSIMIGSLLGHMGWTFLSILNLIAYFVFDFFLSRY